MNQYNAAIKLIKLLNKNGYLAYIVGGFVRDKLLNIPSNDIDITTNAKPEDLKRLFKTKETTAPIYLSCVVLFEGFEFELTSFRCDIKYNDHRHPVTKPASSLDDDLKRRDFTINALVLDKDEKIIDLFDGLSDLKNKTIRVIGNPFSRFDDDALRILRACYFAAKLNFDIEPQTLKGMQDASKYISFLSTERILEEISKLLSSAYYKKGLEYLKKSNASSLLGLDSAISCLVNSSFRPNLDDLLLLASYFKEGFNLNLTKNKANLYKKALELIKIDYFDNYILYCYSIEELLLANKAKQFLNKPSQLEEELKAIKEALPIKSRKDLAINIKEVIEALNLEQGPWINELLIKLEKEILLNKLKNEKNTIIKFIKEGIMSDIENYTYYGKIKGINTSDGMQNLLVTLGDGSDINVKTEDKNKDIKVGYIYKLKVGRHSNSDRAVFYLFEYQRVAAIEDLDEVDKAYRMFDHSCPYSLAELKDSIYNYIMQIKNETILKITKKALKKCEKSFFIYPAGQKLHHNYVGGLAHHTLGMLNLANDFARNFPYLNKDYLFAGVILHDLGKTSEFTGVENTEYSLEGQLLGHLVIGGFSVHDISRELGLEDKEEVLILEHMVISHHGQPAFGACKRPQTAEAAALWYIDTLDSKFRVLGTELEHTEAGEFTDIIGVMEKTKFYKPKN